MLSTTTLLLAVLSTASLTQAAFLLDGPDTLTACETAHYNWTGGATPYNLNLGDTDRVLKGSTDTDWLVDYPAGTVLNVRIDSGSGGSPNVAYAGTKVVQAGSSTTCIPNDHLNNAMIVSDPVEFITVPENITACETYTWSWSGGTAPYTVQFYAVNSGGDFASYTTSSTSYSWNVNFGNGSTVYAYVAGANYWTNSAPAYSKTMYVYENAAEETCVAAANVNASLSDPPPRVSVVSLTSTRSIRPSSTTLVTGNRSSPESSLSSGAIAGIIVGIIALVVIYLIYFFVRRRQKRNNAQLGMGGRGDVVGMRKLGEGGEGQEMEKVVVK